MLGEVCPSASVGVFPESVEPQLSHVAAVDVLKVSQGISRLLECAFLGTRWKGNGLQRLGTQPGQIETPKPDGLGWTA